MRREYRQRPDDVISRRIGTAAAAPGRPVDGNGSARAMALLSILADDGERPWARRAVARYLTCKPHGCKGRKCGYGVHEEHLAVRDELLDVLGLGEQR